MDIFRDLGDTISRSGQAVSNGAKNMAETAKRNSQISDYKKINAQLFQQLGEKYYVLHAQDPDERLNPLIWKIKENMNSIDRLNEEIVQLKGMTKCPLCNADNIAGAKFCSSCGREMPEWQTRSQGTADTVKFCIQCGAELLPGDAFCVRCGTQVAVKNVSQGIQESAMHEIPAENMDARKADDMDSALSVRKAVNEAMPEPTRIFVQSSQKESPQRSPTEEPLQSSVPEAETEAESGSAQNSMQEPARDGVSEPVRNGKAAPEQGNLSATENAAKSLQNGDKTPVYNVSSVAVSEMRRFCIYCGAEIMSDEVFCSQCGKKAEPLE